LFGFPSVEAVGEKLLPVVIPGSRSDDCRFRCAYVICRDSGLAFETGKLRVRLPPESGSLESVRMAMVESGFGTQAVELSWDDLYAFVRAKGHYAILHCRGDHFVSAVGFSGRHVRLFDPATALFSVNETFLRERYQWNGIAILVTTPEVEI